MQMALEYPVVSETALLDVMGPRRIRETAVDYAPTAQIRTKPTGFMDAYDFTLNPYRGCSFGCAYCYAAFLSRDAAKRDFVGPLGECERKRRCAPRQTQARLLGRQAHLYEQRHRPLPAH